MKDSPLVVTIPEACEALSVGHTTIYALIRPGQLKSVKIGRATRIPVDSIRELAGVGDTVTAIPKAGPKYPTTTRERATSRQAWEELSLAVGHLSAAVSLFSTGALADARAQGTGAIMEKIYYPGIVERSADGFCISFPDLPGCVSAGDDMQALAANAEAALKLHVSGMLDDGEELPAPSDPLDVPADPDVTEAARLMVGVDVEQALKEMHPVEFDADNPEWAAEDFAKARRAAEVLPPEVLEAFGKANRAVQPATASRTPSSQSFC